MPGIAVLPAEMHRKPIEVFEMRERISAQVGRWPVLAGVLLWPALAAAQQTTTEAPPAHPVGVLMIFTIGAALAIGVGLLVMFLRKRSNREAMRRLNDE